MSQQWYVQTAKGNAGPFAPAKLRQLAEAGKITPETRLSLDGSKWVRAASIKGLTFPAASPAESRPGPRATESDADDTYDVIPAQPPTVAREVPTGGSVYQGLRAKHVEQLYPSPSDQDTPALSTARGLPLRMGLSALIAAIVALGVRGLVGVARFRGLVNLDTINASLAARVILPGVVFLVVFGFLFWWFGREPKPTVITAEMSDEEIARALKGR
jgi:hypothetical protein